MLLLFRACFHLRRLKNHLRISNNSVSLGDKLADMGLITFSVRLLVKHYRSGNLFSGQLLHSE
jgi:hypothetical protein